MKIKLDLPWKDNGDSVTFFGDHTSLFFRHTDPTVDFVVNDNEVAEMIYQNNIGMSVPLKDLKEFFNGPEENFDPIDIDSKSAFYVDRNRIVFNYNKNNVHLQDAYIFKVGQFDKLKSKINEWSEK